MGLEHSIRIQFYSQESALGIRMPQECDWRLKCQLDVASVRLTFPDISDGFDFTGYSRCGWRVSTLEYIHPTASHRVVQHRPQEYVLHPTGD